MKNPKPEKKSYWFGPMFWLKTGVILGSLMILAMIILPHILRQVAVDVEHKSEAKSILGAMNRAQQTVFAERYQFAQNLEELAVPIGYEKYYTFHMVEGEVGLIMAKGIDNKKNGTQDHIAGINYDPESRIFSTAVCRATTKSNNYTIVNPTEAMSNYGRVLSQEPVKCEKGTQEIR